MKKLTCLLLIAVLLLSLAVPAWAAAGSSRADAIVQTGEFSTMLSGGATLWFTYSNPELVASGEFMQNLNVSCATTPFTVTYGEVGDEKTIDSDADGFVNVVLNDKDRTGNYTFAITNKSSSGRPVPFSVRFESLPKYVLTEQDLFLGDNALSYNDTAPAALYSFSSGDVVITDDDGNVVSTVAGGGAGTYKFTVLNTAGEELRSALLGNWGTIGYPLDLTGDLKTYTYTWNAAEADASLLIGVSNVYEDFIIRVERTGDYVNDQDTIVFEDYVNVHTPGDFEIPAGNKVEFDITKSYTLVADNSGVYHLNTVDGPVVYVDMINNVVDLYGAYHNPYGAVALRGIYTNELGVTCGYEFFGALEVYADALDANGYYPMTVDFEAFIKCFGAAQGWFTEGYTPYDEIENGGNPDSYWLVEAFYIDTTSNEGTGSNTPDTNDPEGNTPGESTPGTGTPDAGTPGVGTPDAGTPDAGTPDAGTPDAGTPDAGTPGAGTPSAGTPNAGTPGTGTSNGNASNGGVPGVVVPAPDKDSNGNANADDNGLGVAPEKAPQTGDCMFVVAAVAVVITLGYVVVRRRREMI